MLDILKEFETDEKLEVTGARKQYKGATFLVARAHNENFLKEYSRLSQEHSDVLLAGGEASAKQGEKNTVEAIAKTVLVGWEGVVDSKGKDVPYSVETAIKYLGVKDFFSLVYGWANNIDNYRKAVEKLEAKN